METLNTCLKDDKISTLRNLIGKQLNKYRHDEFFLGKGIIVGNAEFFVDNKVYAVTNYCHGAPFFWGDEDICDMDFKEIREEDAKSYCENVKQIDFPLNKTIKDIAIVNDQVEEFENGAPKFNYKFTRGIIFIFDDVELAFEKDNWMQELIDVHKGKNVLDEFQSPDEELSEWAENQKSINTREIIHLSKLFKR